MAINKITPRALDKSTDYKLVPSTALIDAVNVVYGDNASSEDGGGDAGVVKNLKGNSLVEFATALEAGASTPQGVGAGVFTGDQKVVGSVVDDRLKVAFFFVYHEDPSRHSIEMYDPYGVFSLPAEYTRQYVNQSTGGTFDTNYLTYGALDRKHVIRTVCVGSFLNFKQNSVIQGNVVYSKETSFPVGLPGSAFTPSSLADKFVDTFEKGIHLYFTDNLSEPKKIDVVQSMCYLSFAGGASAVVTGASLSGTQVSDGYYTSAQVPFTATNFHKLGFPTNGTEEIIFSHAVRPTPLIRPTVNFTNDPLRNTSNFSDAPGFQFSYQFVFADGSESPISVYSTSAFPPSVIAQGDNPAPNHQSFNLCKVRVPTFYSSQLNGDSRPWYNIIAVRVLAREGEFGNTFLLDEIKSTDDYTLDAFGYFEFDFYNDRVSTAISPDEVNKFFDAVPQKAEAQAIVDNRLVYGNYQEGYEGVRCESNITVIPADRPDELFASAGTVNTFISPSDREQQESPLNPSNSAAGAFSGTPMAGVVQNKGAGFSISFNQMPDNVSSGDTIRISVTLKPSRNWHLYNTESNTPAGQGDSFHSSRQMGDLKDDTDNFDELKYASTLSSGENFLKGGSLVANESAGTAQYAVQVAKNAYRAFGRTPGIATLNWTRKINSGNATFFGPFNKEFQLGTSAANPYIVEGDALTFRLDILCNTNQYQNGGAKSIIKRIVKRALTISDYSGDAFEPGFVVQNRSINPVVDQNLVLDDYGQIQPGSANADKIMMVAGAFDEEPDGNKYCRAAVIAKTQKVTFYLEQVKVGTYAGTTAQDSSVLDNVDDDTFVFRLGIKSIENLDLWTCIRQWKPQVDGQSPWVAVKKTSMQNNTEDQIFGLLDGATGQANTLIDPLLIQDSEFYNVTRATKYIGWLPSTFSANLDEEYDNDINASGVVPNRRFLPPGYTTEFGGPDHPDSFSKGNVNPEARHFGLAMRNALGYATSIHFHPALNTTQTINLPFDQDDRALMVEENLLTENGMAAVFSGFGGFVGIGGTFVTGAVQAVTDTPPALFAFSLMDGEVGPGGFFPNADNGVTSELITQARKDSALGIAMYNPSAIESSDRQSTFERVLLGPYFTGKIYLGHVTNGNNDITKLGFRAASFGPSGASVEDHYDNGTGGQPRSMMPHIQGYPTIGLFENADEVSETTIVLPPASNDENGNIYSLAKNYVNETTNVGVSFEGQNATAEFFSTPIFDFFPSSLQTARSFKTSAFHNMGVVYYDDAGRRSFVNPLGSFYVPGYSNEERGSAKGAVEVGVQLFHDPPKWADAYQLAYAPNSTIGDFVQYSTSDAFIQEFGEELADVVEGKIYIPLHYLQKHPISHTKEFGAIGVDQTDIRYKYAVGDKLRIVSYGEASDRIYPYNYVFDVVEVVNLLPTSDEYTNPLGDTTATTGEGSFNNQFENQKFIGEFVVVNNNPNATGFNFTEIADEQSRWNQNVIFEIFSPKKPSTYDENRVYYEVGNVYRTLETSSGDKKHSTAYIQTNEGDVFFRQAAVNFNEEENGQYTPLIGNPDITVFDGEVDYKSNFLSAFVEDYSASDLFASKLGVLGRQNVVVQNARTTRRETGLIYSEKSQPEGRAFRYSSFSLPTFPFKDLEEAYGNINYICDYDGNLLVIQKDRVTLVPVSANLLANATGQEQLIAANEVLGKERVYATRGGSDNNPESVVKVDKDVYFAHKTLGKVFRFSSGSGVEDISDVKMSTYFRKAFQDILDLSGRADKKDVRVVGGYDPVKEEYLVTLLRPTTLDSVASDSEPELIYGCTDPTSINYNPIATFNNGTCLESDDDTPCAPNALGSMVDSIGVESNGVSFGAVGIGSSEVYEGPTPFFENEGDCVSFIASTFLNDPLGVFDIAISDYELQPGESSVLTITAHPTANSPSGLQAMIGPYEAEFTVTYNNGGDNLQSFTFPLSIDLVDPTDIQVGNVVANIYIGNVLVDQAFAQQQNGTWEIVVNQDNVIQSVNNSYAFDGANFPAGRRARVRVELQVSNTLGVEILPTDSITITGRIIDGAPGFRFKEI